MYVPRSSISPPFHHYCIFVLLTYRLEPGPGTRVIATGYPVPKTGNAANH